MRAITPVIGTVLMIALTLAVGFATWAWASSSANSSEKAFGININNQVNCLSWNYAIVNANFSSSNSKLVTIWFYNSGSFVVNFASLQISNASGWLYTNTTSAKLPSLAVGLIKSANFNVGTSFTPGQMYTFKSVAKCQGSITSTYQQVR